MSEAQEYINRVCEHRGLPFVLAGAKCVVDGKNGEIVNGNHSGNFQVKFENGAVLNCHPYWKMTIYDSNWSILYMSDDQ